MVSGVRSSWEVSCMSCSRSRADWASPSASFVTWACAVRLRRTSQAISTASRTIREISAASSQMMWPCSRLRSRTAALASVYQVSDATSCQRRQVPNPRARAKPTQPRWYGTDSWPGSTIMAATQHKAHTVHTPIRWRRHNGPAGPFVRWVPSGSVVVKAVASTAHRFDRKVGLQLDAQPAQTNLDEVAARIEVHVPDVVEQLLAGAHVVAAPHQVGQQCELALAQDRRAMGGDRPTAVQVELYPAHLEVARFASRGWRLVR